MSFANRAGAWRNLAAALFGLLLCGPSFAQYRDQPPDDDIRQTVARVSYLNGSVSYARGDDPDNWQTADLNVPMTLGDRIYTGRGGRAELAIQGGAYIRLNGDTDLEALNLTDDTQQLSLKAGSASFQLRRLGSDEVFEVDTPNAAVTFDAVGDYRIDVDQDGNSRVLVRRGRALVAAGGGQVTVQSGDEMDINGLDAPRYDVFRLASPDGFDRWVSVRAGRVTRSHSRQYVSEDIVGVADLDDNGSWSDVPEYGRAWSPARVAVGWTPYRDGHWVWQDPWGWTWVSTESWGWAPYHYGRWVTYSSRWYWVPTAPRTYARYSPALVAFVGGGPGFSGAVTVRGGGFVGWFPLAPRDPFVPWWGSRRSNVNVTNVTYVNRTYVTVVRQDTFVSGGLVARSVVRDQAVMRDVAAAPVFRGPIPIVPTQASLRVAVSPGLPAPMRPPAAVIQRAVVARVAPPPAPPSFASKVEVIRQNQGAPVAPVAAARISEQRGATRPAAPIRPVVSEPGKITLAPAAASERRDQARAAGSPPPPQPVAVAPVRGREIATSQQPGATGSPGEVRRVERGRQVEPVQPSGQQQQQPAGQPSGQNQQQQQQQEKAKQEQQQLQQQQQQQQEKAKQQQEQQKLQQQQQQDKQRQDQERLRQQELERQRIQQQQQQQQQQQLLEQRQKAKDQQLREQKAKEQQLQEQKAKQQQLQEQKAKEQQQAQPAANPELKRQEQERLRQQQLQQQQLEQKNKQQQLEEKSKQQQQAAPPDQNRGRQPEVKKAPEEAKKAPEKAKDDKAKKDDKKKDDKKVEEKKDEKQ